MFSSLADRTLCKPQVLIPSNPLGWFLLTISIFLIHMVYVPGLMSIFLHTWDRIYVASMSIALFFLGTLFHEVYICLTGFSPVFTWFKESTVAFLCFPLSVLQLDNSINSVSWDGHRVHFIFLPSLSGIIVFHWFSLTL